MLAEGGRIAEFRHQRLEREGVFAGGPGEDVGRTAKLRVVGAFGALEVGAV